MGKVHRRWVTLNHHSISRNTTRQRFFAMVFVLICFSIPWDGTTNLVLYQADEVLEGRGSVPADGHVVSTQTRDNSNQIQKSRVACAWEPGRDDPCVGQLTTRIRTSATSRSGRTLRWLFLGDSTMSRMFKSDRLLLKLNTPPCTGIRKESGDEQSTAPDPYECKFKGAKQCDMDSIFDGLERAEIWKPPNATAEGPRRFASNAPFCTDCVGCSSSIILCRPNPEQMAGFATNVSSSSPISTPLCPGDRLRGSSGGYLSVEYARDKEIQTTLYETTQENLAHWLKNSWNSPTVLVEELGKPVCVLSVGNHDSAIPGITLEVYMQNVKAYLSLIVDECSHIVWLSNTSPATNEYQQTMNQTQVWNLAVLDHLISHHASKASYIDVFEASLHAHHADNIHMSKSWYKSLNGMFSKVIKDVSSRAMNDTVQI